MRVVLSGHLLPADTGQGFWSGLARGERGSPESLLRHQYFAKIVEIISKRSNHRPPFALSRGSTRETVDGIALNPHVKSAKSGARVLLIPL